MKICHTGFTSTPLPIIIKLKKLLSRLMSVLDVDKIITAATLRLRSVEQVSKRQLALEKSRSDTLITQCFHRLRTCDY